MKRIAVVATLALSLPVQAAPPDSEPTKVAVKSSASTAGRAVNQKRFEALYRAGKAIEGSDQIGQNIPEFKTLLRNLATEVAIGRDFATSANEKNMIAAYADALGVLKDAATIWEESRGFQSIESDREAWCSDDEVCLKGDARDAAARRSLPMLLRTYVATLLAGSEVNDPVSLKVTYSLLTKDTFDKFFRTGFSLLEKASRIYLGQKASA